MSGPKTELFEGLSLQCGGPCHHGEEFGIRGRVSNGVPKQPVLILVFFPEGFLAGWFDWEVPWGMHHA